MAQRTRGTGAQHEARRTEIADAVLATVAADGIAAVSLGTVAARAGVSAGRVQHYFPSKELLITAAFERGNELSTARIGALLARPGHAQPRDVLTVVLTELVPHDPESRTHLRVRQAFTALALSHEGIATRLRADYAELHDRLAEELRRDADRLRPGTPASDTAVGLVALAEGLAYYVLIGVCTPGVARHRVLAALAALYPPVAHPSAGR